MKRKGWTPSKTNESIIGPLVKALKENQEEGSYYHSWKANIAMAFQDEYNSERRNSTSKKDIHEIANEAADRFLQQLITE